MPYLIAVPSKFVNYFFTNANIGITFLLRENKMLSQCVLNRRPLTTSPTLSFLD